MLKPALSCEAPHAVDIDSLYTIFQTNPKTGLTDEQVISKYHQFGRNILPTLNKRSPFKILISQFTNSIVIILLLAAFISFLYRHYVDVYIILGLVFVNAIVGFIQEFQAEKSLDSLKHLLIPQTTVRRNGQEICISSHELVPGDIIIVNEGDSIPADARLINGKNIKTNESSLTGESLPVEKKADILNKHLHMAEQSNMVWMGTAITNGKGEALVISIGSSTQLGAIASNLKAMNDKDDHFKTKTNELARQMGLIAIGTVILMFLVGYFIRGIQFQEILMFSIASLVSAVPEGLPVILTIVLALSAKRMVKRHAIVRRLSATETLAVVDTIVTDKTGTLTQNLMTVRALRLPYQPNIDITANTNSISIIQDNTTPTSLHYPLQKLIDIMSSCHSVRREFSPDGEESYTGEATEISLVRFADQASRTDSYLPRSIHQLEDLPFSQEARLRASIIIYDEHQKKELFVIGSPESVLSLSHKILMPDHHEHDFTPAHHQHIESQLTELNHRGMRTLAVGYRSASHCNEINDNDVKNIVFVGLVGIIDPPRPETKKAVSEAKEAGITVIMATGDHPVTAEAIAEDLGLINRNETKQVMTETEFSELSDDAAKNCLKSVRVFARMTPSSKMRLAQLLQQTGKVVAMTGDGVNDAPALKQADIGISMGKNGTDVAREASDIILTDDNFATIISAIEEGRTQLRNVRRTSFFYITTNLAETLTLITFLFLGLPIPLLPKQILWLNVVTAGITDIALAMEPSHEDVIHSPPKPKNEPILNKQVIPYLAIIVGVILILSVLFFIWYEPQGIAKARTMVFVVLALTQLFSVLNLRSIKISIFSIGVFSSKSVNAALLLSLLLLFGVIYIPGVNSLFEFHTINIWEFIFCLTLSSLVFWLSEGYKKLFIKKDAL